MKNPAGPNQTQGLNSTSKAPTQSYLEPFFCATSVETRRHEAHQQQSVAPLSYRGEPHPSTQSQRGKYYRAPSLSDKPIPMQPTQNDVLSGRGACFNHHPGNKKFRIMLERHRVRSEQPQPFPFYRGIGRFHLITLTFLTRPHNRITNLLLYPHHLSLLSKGCLHSGYQETKDDDIKVHRRDNLLDGASRQISQEVQ